MKKYKVTLLLMVDPTSGDKTTAQIYYVEAETKQKAYDLAEKMQSKDRRVSIRHLSIFDYKVDEY